MREVDALGGGLEERWRRLGRRLRALNPESYYRYLFHLEARLDRVGAAQNEALPRGSSGRNHGKL